MSIHIMSFLMSPHANTLKKNPELRKLKTYKLSIPIQKGN